MRFFICLVVALSLVACSSEKKEETSSPQSTTVAASPDSVAKTSSAEPSPSNGISALKSLTAADAPKSISYKGKPTDVYQFSDKEGEHLIVVAETGETKSPKAKQDERDREICVYHLLKKGDTYSEVWKALDYIRNCEFDLIVDMRPESMEITDLDKDGIAEISFAYFLNCVSDVSPHEMKLLMYEGTNKYALRGTAKLIDIKSKYTYDEAFKSAPAEFLKFAKQKWVLFEDQAAG